MNANLKNWTLALATIGTLSVLAPAAHARNHGGNSGNHSNSNNTSSSSIGSQGFVAKQHGQHLPKGAQSLTTNGGNANAVKSLKNNNINSMQIQKLGKNNVVDLKKHDAKLKHHVNDHKKQLGFKDINKINHLNVNKNLNGKLGIKPIDPGFGNGKGKHFIDCCPTWNHCHSHCFPWPWHTGCVLGGFWGGYCDGPVYCGPVYTQPYPIDIPVVVDVDAPVNVTVPVTTITNEASGAALADLGLSDLKLVDIGNPAQGLGPMYRLTIRNIGKADAGSFVAAVFASPNDQPNEDMLRAGQEVPGLEVGGITVVDVRLPIEVMTMKTANGVVPFKSLFIVLDARNEVQELNEQNNIIPALREQIQPLQ